ncbi:uncharacterized protein L969DRAFT_20147 [Mixia osmundae IAM 14324]|uniref:Peptide hydrolase n=1 Tax=Mixia osmundae (strain CBS 9802 / IAM 14324 / JCM 22182 / KY 12970) TaxID=764103 RepID=G7E1U4_MIXOS|nr:uncharacterized protein L969DRAFT_20147 [Mixia osmundae IAM 14324]KEI36750.1 hypothetical protein L969DRAFT_20147 [Mixia osmundae IAM 14324]GAA96804.1 hypothetical protein E5Q_03476 [Mixia osmundae IAM 14324]
MRLQLASGLLATSLLCVTGLDLYDDGAQTVFRSTATADDVLASRLESLPESHLEQLVDHMRSLPEKRLISTSPGEQRWITEGEKALLVLSGTRFIDLTDSIDERALESKSMETLPASLKHADKLSAYFDALSTDRMKAFLTTFSGFRTRYYRSQTGKESSEWLQAQVQQLALKHKSLNMSVAAFPHSWGQSSVIARLPRATHPDAAIEAQLARDEQVVIISAHQDSTNLLPFLAAPGADDDGSGSTTIFEALTVLVEKQHRPVNHTVEFHWYSAEEGGLLGSQAVSQAYAGMGQKVKGVQHFDMTAWVKAGTEPRMGIIQDYISPELTAFVEKLGKEYVQIPLVQTQCGYACSDHASWTKIGAPSAFAIEATFQDSNTQNIHSTRDTIDHPEFSFKHAAQFSRLAIAFVAELAG